MKKTYNIFKKIGRRNLAITIVALILTSVMLIGATYSWIENITAVQITNKQQDGTGNNTSTLKFASDIDAGVVLGSCGPNGIIPNYPNINDEYEYTTAVNLGSYFSESGGMHLTTCSGNGESFYFKTLKGSSDAKKYRIGTEDDENVNYISATFMVSSPDAEVDMWFNAPPKVNLTDSNNNTDSIARYSITVDGETNVYSSTGEEYAHIIDADGTTTKIPVRKTAEYTYGHSQNVKDGKKNGNVLFRVGETPKKVTVRIWLQYAPGEEEYTDIYSDVKPNINMVLVSTWAKTRTITIRDCTSQNKNEYWMSGSDGATLFVALASDTSRYWQVTNWKNGTGSVDIPSYYYAGEKICVIRCSDKGWNNGNVQCNGIWCWNYWETELPKGFENLMFNIVGNTPAIDNNGAPNQNDTGYSFWGVAEQITVTDNVGLTHEVGVDANRMLVRDVDTGNYYPLYDTGNGWRGYIPRTSDKIEFLYKEDTFQNNAINSKNSTSIGDSCYQNEDPDYRWGYTSSMNNQTRPYNDVTYTILSTDSGTWTDLIETNYRLAGYFSGSSSWTENIKFYKETKDDKVAFAYINLKADKLSQIKVVDVSNSENKKYYSNKGVMCRSNSSGWLMETTVSQNMGFISDGYDGTYKFEFNTETKKLSVTYPGGGDKSRVYLVTNYDGYLKYAYMWKDGTSNKNADYPGQKMDSLGNIDSYYIFILKYPDGLMPNRVIFSGQGNENNTDQKWQSIELVFSSYQLYTNPTKQ